MAGSGPSQKRGRETPRLTQPRAVRQRVGAFNTIPWTCDLTPGPDGTLQCDGLSLNETPWTRATVRRVIDEADEHPGSANLMQIWLDAQHSRILHLIKAFVGDNQIEVRSFAHPFPRDCLDEINGVLPQPCYVKELKERLEEVVRKVQCSHFEGVYNENELLRRAMCDYLWSYVGAPVDDLEGTLARFLKQDE